MRFLKEINFIYVVISGFDRRRCDTSGKWEPEAPTCKETLCKNITTPSNGTMILTTLRIGGRATFKCDFGFNLKGIADIECLSSGSWSAWPPTCIEIDCGQPHEIENGRLFLPLRFEKTLAMKELSEITGDSDKFVYKLFLNREHRFEK